jgi:hypothetical protein
MTDWSEAVLRNGLGRYAEALAVAEPATEESYLPLSMQLVLPELIEAAANRTDGPGPGSTGPAVGHDR